MRKLVSIASLFLLTGCLDFKPIPDTTQFYVLRHLPCEQRFPHKKNVYLERIDMPDYMDRSQIVTIIRNNEVALSENCRWAEDIRANISRVLLENLTELLPDCTFQRERSLRDTEKLSVKFFEFIFNKEQECVLCNVQWSLKRPDGKIIDKLQKFSFKSPFDYASIAEAMSLALSSLSTSIAEAI